MRANLESLVIIGFQAIRQNRLGAAMAILS